MGTEELSGTEAQEPLLLNWVQEKKVNAFVLFVKWVLSMLMCLIFIAWTTLIFVFPAEPVSDLIENLAQASSDSLFGSAGILFLIFSGPVLLIAILAIIHSLIPGEEKLQVKKKTSKYLWFRLRTFPVLVDGPFGVVSAAEFIGICIFGVYIFWSLYVYTARNLATNYQLPSLLKSVALQLASIGMFCLAFLFLPVARGSVLLRFIDIPFEQAIRYHVWLGHLTMWIFTLHGLCNVIAWAMQGILLQEILSWDSDSAAYLAGLITLLAGLLMWVTSLSLVRKRQFKLFFYTHQLYIVFIVFFALHVGDFNFSISSAGIFLFMLDRFLRFCQSRTTVNIKSATCFPCGTVQLVLSKPANLRYNALSFIFIQIRELSWLQWHPFSVSSSPLDGNKHISVLIKVLGQWTAKLRGNILEMAGADAEGHIALPQATLTASVEGPYGHTIPYHLMYENLILIAGGIGVSPFFAILSDILHRTRDRKPCPPKNVMLIWAIKKSDELPLLSTLDMDSLCPEYPNKLNLDIRIYVTRESGPPLEEGTVERAVDSCVIPISKSNRCGMSVLGGTGSNTWLGLYFISSIIGFIVLMALVDIFYMNPYNITAWWYRGFIFIVCMVVSVLVFGGLVVFLWHLWGKRTAALEESEDSKEKLEHTPVMHHDLSQRNPVGSRSIFYGSRPEFQEIFESVSKQWGYIHVGVVVCGPLTLQTSVAKECRSQSLKRGSANAVFHFHSLSFDL